MSATKRDYWWKAPKSKVNGQVLAYVQAIEQASFDTFNRFVQLTALYDPNNAVTQDGSRPEASGFITENVIATNVDTVAAIIAAIDLRARIMTDDGDWGQQRIARQQEWYAEGLEKIFDVAQKARAAFKAGPGIRGTGIMYVGIDGEKLVVEHVLADDIIVDERECRNGGSPKQIHRRKLVDRDDLKAKYPKFAVEIDKAQLGGGTRWQSWAGYRPIEGNDIIVIHSHRLPIGEPEDKGYVAGRETITIDGCDLLDQPWEDCEFPYAKIVWSERDNGWYGIGLAERIMGHQQVLNRSNWQIDKLVNLNAAPTTYVSMIDAHLTAKVQRPGTITVIKGSPPITPTPPSISPEVYKRVGDVKASASEESGVNRMLANGTKPAGLDSGAALRELNHATTQRFATQEKAYEDFRRDIVMLMLNACKKLGKKAPVINRRSRFGAKRIVWSKVDLKDTKVQISMASSLARTPAGRTQLVLELAQGGIITQDSAKRLIQHPDVERELSLYTAALENIERCFDEIADGEIVMPEPFMNLKLSVWRGQQTYLKWRDDGAPEEVLESLRQFVVQAAYMDSAQNMPAANENAVAGPDMSMVPSNDGGGMPPTAALASQAMQLKAV